MTSLHSVPDEALDRELSDFEIASISQYFVDWPVKARDLGLDDGDIDNIQRNHQDSYRLQKAVMLRRWKELFGERATLRELVRTAEQRRWGRKFIHDVIEELGYHMEGNLIVSQASPAPLGSIASTALTSMR